MMAIKLDCALLSIYAYKTKMGRVRNNGTEEESENKPNLDLMGYEEIDYQEDDHLYGFSYGIFKNKQTKQVVISYTGTNESLLKDFAMSNIPAGLMGQLTGQLLRAAEVYARVVNGMKDSAGNLISDSAGSNVVFAGHSMGGVDWHH